MKVLLAPDAFEAFLFNRLDLHDNFSPVIHESFLLRVNNFHQIKSIDRIRILKRCVKDLFIHKSLSLDVILEQSNLNLKNTLQSFLIALCQTHSYGIMTDLDVKVFHSYGVKVIPMKINRK